MDGDIEEGDFGRDRLGRDDVDLARETSFKFQERWRSKTFLNFIEGLRMSSLREVRESLVYFYNYDGVISGLSDKKFVPLYEEI